MNARTTVTASMVYLGLLVVVSMGWLGKIRGAIQSLAGTGSVPSGATPTEPVPPSSGSGFDGGYSGGASGGASGSSAW